MTGAALIVQGDALRLPLPDGSVDLVVTSPPYAFLRNYDTGYPDLEVGSEPTPQAYLEALWAATAEMMRVLKPTGSAFIDLGDKYASHPTGHRPDETLHDSGGRLAHYQPGVTVKKLAYSMAPAKSLMLLPERYRVGCVDRLGLIARAVLVWDKPNGLPESVTDRVRRSHEEWVHLTRSPRYYSATDEIREPQTDRVHHERYGGRYGRRDDADPIGNGHTALGGVNPLGKLPGSVWSIASEPLDLPGYFVTQDGTLLDFIAPTRGRPRPRTNGNGHGLFDPDTYAELIVGEDAGAWRWIRSTGINSSPWPKTDDRLQLHTGAAHYAAFPSEWPRRLIKAFSPPGICVECGQGRVPVVERTEVPHWKGGTKGTRNGLLRDTDAIPRTNTDATILGYACPCAPFTDHPGSGESSGPRSGDVLMEGQGWPRFEDTPGPPSRIGTRPKVGPWREWHLDRWTPPPTRPSVVLDPFSGTGTTAMVARALGRIGIGVDLSHAYGRAARWRVAHDGAKAISRTWGERQGSLL